MCPLGICTAIIQIHSFIEVFLTNWYPGLLGCSSEYRQRALLGGTPIVDRKFVSGMRVNSLARWFVDSYDVDTEFHGDGRGVPLNQNASKIHIKVYR